MDTSNNIQGEKFKVILRHQDSDACNLNKKFESYGGDTLEAKVPIVTNQVVMEKLQNSSSKKQVFETMRLQAQSASGAMQGRRPRTKNAVLKMIEVNGDTIIQAIEVRDRSPVERSQLDDDLDAYMKERERILTKKKEEETETTSRFIAALTMDDGDADADIEIDEDDKFLYP